MGICLVWHRFLLQRFTTETFYARTPLHHKPCTPEGLLHQTPFKPEGFHSRATQHWPKLLWATLPGGILELWAIILPWASLLSYCALSYYTPSDHNRYTTTATTTTTTINNNNKQQQQQQQQQRQQQQQQQQHQQKRRNKSKVNTATTQNNNSKNDFALVCIYIHLNDLFHYCISYTSDSVEFWVFRAQRWELYSREFFSEWWDAKPLLFHAPVLVELEATWWHSE